MKAVCEKYASNSIPPTGFSCSVSYRLQICNEQFYRSVCSETGNFTVLLRKTLEFEGSGPVY